MSHFIRCDRCDRQDSVMGQLSLPPGWQTILHADLCEPCCQIVKEFIRFKPSDAERLPVEPIEEVASTPPVGDKLFETAPEPTIVQVVQEVAEQVNSGALDTPGVKCTMTVGPAVDETSIEERTRTRKSRKKLQGQDAILPDVRKPEPPAPDPGVH